MTEIFSWKFFTKWDIGEISQTSDIVDRPSLEMLFRGIEDMEASNRVIREAISTHGYRQSEVAGYIGIHYSTSKQDSGGGSLNSRPKT